MYLVAAICERREMYVGGTHGSYIMKNPLEDRELRYDALASDDGFVFNFLA